MIMAKSKEQEIPKGYKQTEIGVIPNDWDVIDASDACLKIQDGTHFSPKVNGSDFLYITSKNIRFGYMDLSSVSRISTAEHQAIYKRCDVRKGDLLLTKDGANTGNVAINKIDDEFSLLSSVAFLRFLPDVHNAAYFMQQILAVQGQRQIQDAMAGNAITRLTLGKIKRLRFSVPPSKQEEDAIARALSDADTLIEKTEKLIEKKKNIKQGAMQELLTGKRRLPGFKSVWKKNNLGNLANIKTGCRNNKDKVENGKYPFFVRSPNIEMINSYSYACEAILVPGEGNIGNIFHYINGRFDVHQRVYAITHFAEEVSGKFVFYYMMKYFGAHALQNTVKATVDSLRLPTFNNFQILMPPKIEEQLSIANILSEMDAEIKKLESELIKYKNIKQGMMQKLLTGKIRLIKK